MKNQGCKIVMAIIFSTTFSLCANADLSSLLDDMKHYVTTSRHRGDLWQHSIWTAQMLGRWVRNNEQPALVKEVIAELVGFLSPRGCYLLEIAGIVHDIGKAGDLAIEKYPGATRVNDTIYYPVRPNHERIGFEYILHDLPSIKGKYGRAYQMLDGSHYDFYRLFKNFGIDEEEMKIIALLVGLHDTIWSHILNPFNPADKSLEMIAYEILEETNALTLQAEFKPGCTRALLIMSILLQLADAFAKYYPVTTAGESSFFDAQLIVPSPHPYLEDNEQDARRHATIFPYVERVIRTILLVYDKGHV